MRGSSRVTRSLAALLAGLLAGTLAGCGGGPATKPVQVVVTPYADGVGWAPDGQEWVAVDLALYFQEPPYWRLDVQYDVTPTRRAFNLNGADVKATLFQHWDGTNDAALLVFPTPAHVQGQSDEYRLGGSLRYVGRVEKQLGDGRGFPIKPVFDVDLDFPVRFSGAAS